MPLVVGRGAARRSGATPFVAHRRATLSVVPLVVLALAACAGDKSPSDGNNNNNGGDQDTVTVSVHVNVATDQERTPISPLVYGSNQDYTGVKWTIRRLGGNRLTGYNWENNFSNAGADYIHSSDTFMLSVMGLSDADSVNAGTVLTHFHDQSLAMGAASIITVPVAGYVSADNKGAVSVAETAPSARWVKVLPHKPTAFALTPDKTDGTVYVDEEVNFLVSRYGLAGSARGVGFYSLDNEPAIWPGTHPRIHPSPTGARELTDRDIAAASAVKGADPQAQLTGPAEYGFSGYLSCQDAPDWNTVKGSSRWYLDYYLDQFRTAGQTAGKRLLDVLDVHWYPEAQGDHRITDSNATTVTDQDARMQAPRSLWDSTYTEKSWIAQYFRSFLPILPSLQQSIAGHYPGTKLGITEYNYGGGADPSGGLAQADVLGAFGKYGVYLATLWGLGSSDTYIAAAFKLYRDYDGQGAAYGATAVRATTDDVAKTSTYAAMDDAGHLHVIVLNKTRAPIGIRFHVDSPASFARADVWGFDGTSPAITHRTAVSKVTSNEFSYSVPALAALHLILQ
jgi:mannan endo-1,4-beta-mannosidase